MYIHLSIAIISICLPEHTIIFIPLLYLKPICLLKVHTFKADASAGNVNINIFQNNSQNKNVAKQI